MVCRGLGGSEGCGGVGGVGLVGWGWGCGTNLLALITCTVCTNTTKHSQTVLISFLISLHENISITVPSDGDSGKGQLISQMHMRAMEGEE